MVFDKQGKPINTEGVVNAPFATDKQANYPKSTNITTANGGNNVVTQQANAQGAFATDKQANYPRSIFGTNTQATQGAKLSYRDAFAKVQEQAKEAEKTKLPTQKDGGKGLTGWITRNFGNPEKSKEGNRRAIQSITALGQFLRHATNLIQTSRGATPQTIADQTAINDARWKQEDALEADKLQKQKEWERKVAKDMADAEYKNANLALNARRQGETERNNAFNNNIALGRFGMDSESHGWKKEDRPIEQATKAAGLVQKQADATKAENDAKWADKLNQATYNSRVASAEHLQELTAKVREETRKLLNGEGEYELSGNQGSFHRDKPISSPEKTNIIARAHDAGLIDDKVFNAVHAKSAWTSDVEFQTKQDDVIAMILASSDEPEVVRDIFTHSGFRYTPYTPVKPNKTMNLKKAK